MPMASLPDRFPEYSDSIRKCGRHPWTSGFQLMWQASFAYTPVFRPLSYRR